MGPLLPLIMSAIPKIGQIFGVAAKHSSDQRMGENQQQLAQNQQALLQSQMRNSDALQRASLTNANATTRAGMQNEGDQFRAGLDLQQKQFQQREPNVQARQALTGSLMNRIQPLAMSGGSDRLRESMPQMNSIIDAIGPEAREAGGLLAQRGLTGLKNPTQFSALPPVSLPDLLKLPPEQLAQLTQLKGSGLLEKILGGVGLVGSTVGALGDLESVTPKKTYEPSDETGWG